LLYFAHARGLVRGCTFGIQGIFEKGKLRAVNADGRD
jgi:hypothetical protein